MVLLAPFSQGTHLLSVGRLIVVGDQALSPLCHRQIQEYFDEYRSGLRTQPFGAPVLRVRGDEVLLPILTT